jgi:uncharacterized protein
VTRGLALTELAGAYTIARLAPDTALPAWADGPGFVSIARTAEELSILCLAARVPEGVVAAGPWVGFKLQGPFDFAETGIGAAILAPLAEARIGILFVSTFDTDYLFVKEANRLAAIAALRAAGHVVTPL